MIELEVYVGSEEIPSDSFLYELDENDLQNIFNQLTDLEILRFIANKKDESKLKNIAKQFLRKMKSGKNSGKFRVCFGNFVFLQKRR